MVRPHDQHGAPVVREYEEIAKQSADNANGQAAENAGGHYSIEPGIDKSHGQAPVEPGHTTRNAAGSSRLWEPKKESAPSAEALGYLVRRLRRFIHILTTAAAGPSLRREPDRAARNSAFPGTTPARAAAPR